MIIVTGAAGFIGSQVALHFGDKSERKNPEEKILAVDKLNLFTDRPYLKTANFSYMEAKDTFQEKLKTIKDVSLVIHMGAITNTAESNQSELDYWNINYTKTIWNYCTQNKIPLIYASSAATYGDGQNGFIDDHEKLNHLRPLNLYGKSKHVFDQWALAQNHTPPHWYGLKFFNVYGPHENHKARMASSIYHGYNEIKESGKITLFKSHNPNFKDGEQARDFIYVKDILKIMDFLISKKPKNGIYNCGSGQAKTFLEMSQTLFECLRISDKKINWIPTPEQFRAAYQYKTEANMTKLLKAGYKEGFTDLPHGIKSYVDFLT